MSSGSGGTRLDHTSRPSGLGDCALRVATLPKPHEAAAPIVSASAPSGTADARPAAMIPIPASASAPPASCAGFGRSLEQQHREADGERGLQLQDEAGQAGGHALVDAEEQQAELAGGEEDADGDHVLDRHAGAGDEGERERDEAEAQRGEQQRREAVQADVDDDEVDAPDDGDGEWRGGRGGGAWPLR